MSDHKRVATLRTVAGAHYDLADYNLLIGQSIVGTLDRQVRHREAVMAYPDSSTDVLRWRMCVFNPAHVESIAENQE